MSKKLAVGIGIFVFVLGALAGVAIAKKIPLDPGLYVGVEPDQAFQNLLQQAKQHAGDGSWENIRIARVYLVAGKTEQGQEIIDSVLAGKPDKSDWIRIGKAYYAAGNWEKAQEAFDRVLSLAPEDEDWLAQIGAYYNLHGDRDKAEELFQRSFALAPENDHNLAIAGGSYAGVVPD